MKRIGCVLLIGLALCGATWTLDRDVVTFKAGVFAERELAASNAAGAGVLLGADLMCPVGGTDSMILVVDGRRVLVVMTSIPIDEDEK